MHLALVRLIRKLHLNAPQSVDRHGTKAAPQWNLAPAFNNMYAAGRSSGLCM